MRFISFDLETTGTLPGVDRIVEIGALRLIDGEVDAIFSTLVDPRISIPEAASRVNHITDDMVRGKPGIEAILPAFAEFCGADPLVAHNALFDFQFLLADVKRFESPAPKGVVLDSLAIARKVFPGLANYRLGTLVQHLNISTTGDFHRAEADASYCAQLFLKLCERITGSTSAMPPMENLVALSGRAEMRFPQIEPQPKQLDLFGL